MKELKPLSFGPVSQQDLDRYAEAARDPNQIHLCEEVAKEKGFKTTIVHGMLSMAYMVEALFYNFPKEKWRLYRMKARFKQVAYKGDTLRAVWEAGLEKQDGWVVRGCLENQEKRTILEVEAELKPISA